jgi:hypothetical protein
MKCVGSARPAPAEAFTVALKMDDKPIAALWSHAA